MMNWITLGSSTGTSETTWLIKAQIVVLIKLNHSCGESMDKIMRVP